MIAALDNLIFLCVGFTVIWITWIIVPVIYNFMAWVSKGAWSIIKACPRVILKMPFFSFMFALFAFAFPYYALGGFIVFAIMLGDLGEAHEKSGIDN